MSGDKSKFEMHQERQIPGFLKSIGDAFKGIVSVAPDGPFPFPIGDPGSNSAKLRSLSVTKDPDTGMFFVFPTSIQIDRRTIHRPTMAQSLEFAKAAGVDEHPTFKTRKEAHDWIVANHKRIK